MLEESWSLAKACFRIVRKDKEMLIYPAIIAGVVLLIILTFIVSLFYNVYVFVALLFSIPLLIILLPFLGVLFEAAVVGCASIRLEGGDPKIRDGFSIASKRLRPLFLWALISVFVGLLLNAIRGSRGGRRIGTTYRPRPPGFPGLPPMRLVRDVAPNPNLYRFYDAQGAVGSPSWGLGDIIAGVLGMAWSVATFFVIPVIIYEGLSPLKAIRRSWEIVKGVWKETLILKLGFGAIFGLLSLIGLIPLAFGFYTGMRVLPEPVSFEWMGGMVTTSVIIVNPIAVILGIASATAYWVALSCLSFVMRGILRAVLYKYSFSAAAKGEKRCPNCSYKISEPNAIFCPYCGERLQEETPIIPERRDEFADLSRLLRSYI